MKAEVKRIGNLARGRGYVVYAIRHPSQPDHHGHPDGPPIYVGQSKQLWIRADDHMRDGGVGTQGGRLKAGRLHRIMKGFVVPKFEIIDHAPTHLTSLIAETAWARRYCGYGYDLANQWAEHRSNEAANGLSSVPTKRLWNLTVADAIEDEVPLVLRCESCHIYRPVQLETVSAATRLSQLRTLHITCPGCSGPLLQIERPDPATWKWRLYLPRPMGPDG